MHPISTKLVTAAQKIIQKEYSFDKEDITWQRPELREHGDLSTTVALRIAQKAKVPPQEVATFLKNELSKLSIVERIDVMGAGYVNVWFTPEALLIQLAQTREACTAHVKRKKEAPVIVEYSQPNIAKPLGIHHIMSTIIGQAVANLYEHCGHNIVRVNHIGDWGTQFGKLAVAVERWGQKPVSECTIDELLALYVKFHEEAEKDPSLEDAGREAFRKLEQGDRVLRQFWEEVVHITMEAMNRLYKRLHVHIEYPHSESMYEEMMAPILEEGLKKGVFKKGEKGAIVVEFPSDINLPTAVVQKADSATIYMTRDFAQIRYRIDRWHPKAIYYVVDSAQSLHFQQLFATVKLLQWELPHLEHLVIGRMRFKDRKMSTRKGNILKLEEVLDEAVDRAKTVIAEHKEKIQTDDISGLAEMMGVGAVVYGVLSQNRKMDMVFDWDKMLSFDGNSAPYLQYTHARACSVLRKADVPDIEGFPGSVLSLSRTERTLIGTLLQFSEVLEEACVTHMPHKVTQYLFMLCQDFNAFYNSESILQAQEPLRSLRLALTDFTASVLKKGAELLTLRVPDRM